MVEAVSLILAAVYVVGNLHRRHRHDPAHAAPADAPVSAAPPPRSMRRRSRVLVDRAASAWCSPSAIVLIGLIGPFFAPDATGRHDRLGLRESQLGAYLRARLPRPRRAQPLPLGRADGARHGAARRRSLGYAIGLAIGLAAAYRARLLGGLADARERRAAGLPGMIFVLLLLSAYGSSMHARDRRRRARATRRASRASCAPRRSRWSTSPTSRPPRIRGESAAYVDAARDPARTSSRRSWSTSACA